LVDLACLCDVCGKPSAITGVRCQGNRRRLWIRIDAQPDPTNDPALWRGRYQGRVLPIHVYGDTPTAGEYYLARLVCSSTQYVVYIPIAPGGTIFWALYSYKQRLLRINELVDGAGDATQIRDWYNYANPLGYSGQFLTPSSLGQSESATDEDRLVIVFTRSGGTGLAYTADSGATWAISQLATTVNSENLIRKAKFDLSNAGVGYAPLTPYQGNDYEADIKAGYSAPSGGVSRATAWANYVDWHANHGEIKWHKTTDHGATWIWFHLECICTTRCRPGCGQHPQCDSWKYGIMRHCCHTI